MNKINHLDTKECTQDIAWYLTQVESAEELAELTSIDGFTRQRLNRATRLLARDQQEKIRRLANLIAKRRTA